MDCYHLLSAHGGSGRVDEFSHPHSLSLQVVKLCPPPGAASKAGGQSPEEDSLEQGVHGLSPVLGIG